MDTESRMATGMADNVPGAGLVVNDSRAYKFIKRAFDIVASAVGLVICIPIFLIVGIAIKAEDPKGPVIYHQPRIGLNGREFTFYKLRSMYTNADAIKSTLMDKNEMDGPVFKMKNDPRVTKVGRFIRKTSLDELPQLWNVLKGDMSLVGPRPLPTAEELACNAYQRQRELVKPGLTCYWQIAGRNNVSFNDWIELDFRYIREQSLRTDARILIKTVGAVVRGGVRTRGWHYEHKHRVNVLSRIVKTAVCFPAVLLLGAGVITEAGTGEPSEAHSPTVPEGRIGYAICKRTFDIVASAVLSVICLIPCLIIGVMIVAKDPGNPFYKHKRVGLNGKEISVLKFRTMRRGADALEEMLTPEQMEEYKREFKLKDDPRLLGYRKAGDGGRCFGALLRRTSLDELPQIFYNVLLKGDMSFVGPRPILREELEKYYTPAEQEALLSVKPGITGYWQTHGRNDSTYETGERQRLELYYVQSQSLPLDIKILFKTVSVVVHRGGTY